MTTATMRQERQVSPVFIGLLLIMAVSGWAVWRGFAENAGFGVFLFVVSGWIVSLCLHEYAHARTALHGGDITIGAKGYLTLNPLKYTNAVLSILLPLVFLLLGGIGLPGGAVFIERGRIRGRLKHSLISAAGPLTNVAFAVLLMLPFTLFGFDWAPLPFLEAVAFLAMLQVTAAMLNLLPVPGLDGYGVLEPWLSYNVRRQVEPFAPFGMMAVFACLWIPSLSGWFWNLVFAVMDVFHVSGWLPASGQQLFHFW